MTTFVFLQVGEDPNANLMVQSINITNPNARIIQCSDERTKKIEGVSDIFRLDKDFADIMAFRTEAFSKLMLTEPAIYLDTDMLVLNEIFANKLLQDSEVALCERSFHRDLLINTPFRTMDLSEYSNKTLAEVYPILGCFTVTKSYKFWASCLDNLLTLDKKFHRWYGDQEALRNIALRGEFIVSYLPESLVACLPEFIQKNAPPICIHFKGAERKDLMRRYFAEIYK
jgi:hypothetical protein